MMEPENPELDHEWLQLIQVEKEIDKQKKLLLVSRIKDHGDPDEDKEPFWEARENFAKRSDHLDNEDLGNINNLLNSFSKPSGNHGGSNNFNLTNVTQNDALARAFAARTPPQKFNLKSNQKSTTRDSEENRFSYFSNLKEERPIELGGYFLDDEEDDTWDKEDLTGENFYEWNPVISCLETIHESKFKDDDEAKQLNHISGLSEETRLSLSTWQPFIPLEHAFLNYAVQSPPPDFLSQASFLQEPTLTKISTISTSTKRPSSQMKPTSPRLKNPLSRKVRQTEFQDPSEPPSRRLRTRPCKPFYTPTYSETPTPRRPSFTNSSTKSTPPNHEPPELPKEVLSSNTSGRSQRQDWKPSMQTRTPYTHNWTRPSPKSKTTRWPNWTGPLPESSKTLTGINTEPDGPILQDSGQ